ncbi:hypothetical protein EYZ11_012841 [Aspergillus tanneri]|uniref:ABC toxin N-terminal domain-containing protein n=1 Tax=Aspergillus tanneri TaxID=1220188 RepID=A0A4S3IZ80_9EURO|nr:hypothetical protein EYZ11_012841 [Aspergillus tanneri]
MDSGIAPYGTPLMIELFRGTAEQLPDRVAFMNHMGVDGLTLKLLFAPATLGRYISGRGITDADGIFEFLIDMQIGVCVQGSRIRQAISTVQLYLRRCTLRLGKVEQVANNTVKMDRYRLWERDDKTKGRAVH